MNRLFTTVSTLSAVIFISTICLAQVNDICGDQGITPSLDKPSANVPYVFGRVEVNGFDPGTSAPKVTVILIDRGQIENKWTTNKSGNFCFKRLSATGGMLVIEIDGVEAERRNLPTFGPAQQREDFVIYASNTQRSKPATTISAKFARPQNEKTIELYKKAAEAEKGKHIDEALKFVKEIVQIDPDDFIAWAKLGTLYFELRSLNEADAAFRRSLELKNEYLPAWLNVGKLRVAQNQLDAAIEILKHTVELDPMSARAYQLLGETYLKARKGTLGAEALHKAIELDPAGMAESHLLLAKLYDLAGARSQASVEYKAFLKKVPDHPDKKKFEKYIKENP